MVRGKFGVNKSGCKNTQGEKMDKTAEKPRRLKKSRKYYVIVGLFIMAIAVVHFTMQITFIKEETLRSGETAVESDKVIEPIVENALPAKQVIEIEPEQVEVKKIEVITIPEVVKAASRRQQEIIPVKTPNKKKVVREGKAERESRAERLRRAERLLTGN